MRTAPRLLLNTPDIELWPGGLLRARSNHDARLLSRARTVLRRKRDGRYLAAQLPEGLMPMVERLAREPGIDAALQCLETPLPRGGPPAQASLPLDRLNQRLQRLGLDQRYAAGSGLGAAATTAVYAAAGWQGVCLLGSAVSLLALMFWFATRRVASGK